MYCLFNSICANCNNLKFVTSHVRMFKTVRTEMVKYMREMMLSGGVLLPTRGVIGKRIKRPYWSQRHQAHSKADKEKRRRQRFLNKRNCLTMVGLYYFSLSYSNALDQWKCTLVKYTDVDSFFKGREWIQYQMSYSKVTWNVSWVGSRVHDWKNKPPVRNKINLFSRAWLFTARRLR